LPDSTLESYVTKKRDKSAALRFFKKTLKRHGQVEAIVTDGLRSYPAAMRDLGISDAARWAGISTIAPKIAICRSDEESGRC
jgi:transposase-like protein